MMIDYQQPSPVAGFFVFQDFAFGTPPAEGVGPGPVLHEVIELGGSSAAPSFSVQGTIDDQVN